MTTTNAIFASNDAANQVRVAEITAASTIIFRFSDGTASETPIQNTEQTIASFEDSAAWVRVR
jgi:hypothetical protein